LEPAPELLKLPEIKDCEKLFIISANTNTDGSAIVGDLKKEIDAQKYATTAERGIGQ